MNATTAKTRCQVQYISIRRARAHLLVSRLQFIGLNAKKSFNTAKRYRFFYRAPTDSPDFARNCENAARCSSNSRPPFRGG